MEQKLSERKNQSSIFLTLEDYEEMRELATLDEEKIEQRANELSKQRENRCYLNVAFDTYSIGSRSKPFVCVDIEIPMHSNQKDVIWDVLSKSDDMIYAWCENNLKTYSKKLRDMNQTARICKQQEKQIGNLKYRCTKYKLLNVFLWGIIAILSLFLVSPLVNKLIEIL